MGYRNDQFFNLPTGTETGAEGRVARSGIEPGLPALFPTDNPPFVYPDRVVRTIDQNGNPQITSLERGYIRSLISSVGQTGTIKKCGFQFNPQTITQSVDQPLSMLNFIQQDPGQYLQPMAGSVNFGFDLMFDRSMEMNNPIMLDRATEDNPWELGDPSQVGVLRDLAALFSVIGQGLSESQKTYVQQALAASLQREQEAGTDISVDKLKAATGALEDRTVDGKSVTGLLNMNIGNSAFLMPLPVRVVFSSLYIVEGLVQSSTVNFLKFNTKMVPMQCTVNISMEAKYIGFAKKKTFLSVALDDAKQAAITDDKTEVDVVKGALSAMTYAGQSIEISLAQKVSAAQALGAPLTGLYVDGFKFINLTLPGVAVPPTQMSVYGRLSNSVPVLGGSTFDTVKQMFDDGSPTLTISEGASVEVWGPVFGLEGSPPAPADRFKAPYQTVLKQASAKSTLYLTGQLPTRAVSTGDEWVKLAQGSQAFEGITMSSAVPAPISDDKFYIFRYHGYVHLTVTSNNTFTYTGDGEVWVLVGPTTTKASQYSMNTKVSLTWPPVPSVAEDALGTAPTTQTTPGSTATAPGAVSTVGKKKP